MGHWIHDQMSQTIIPTSGAATATTPSATSSPTRHGPRSSSSPRPLSPSLLNETALDVNGNTINMTPVQAIYAQPSGWNATGFFTGNNA